MLGDFITRCLVLMLGYAYPAFECYKTVEKNKVEIEELRFWCQYWILVAIITVLERVGDIFVSWLPMYGELKLVFFIYLWYPKTKGCGFVYETFLRPYISERETDIDRSILEMRVRVWDFLIYYLKNCTQLGQSTLIQIFQYVLSQSSKFTDSSASSNHVSQNSTRQPPPNVSVSFLQSTEKKPNKVKNWTPPPPPTTPVGNTNTTNRVTEVNFSSQTEHTLDPDTIPDSQINQIRSRLRRVTQ